MPTISIPAPPCRVPRPGQVPSRCSLNARGRRNFCRRAKGKQKGRDSAPFLFALFFQEEYQEQKYIPSIKPARLLDQSGGLHLPEGNERQTKKTGAKQKQAARLGGFHCEGPNT